MMAWLRRMFQRRTEDPEVREQQARAKAQTETVKNTVSRAHLVSAKILDDYAAQDRFRRGQR